MVGQVFTDTVFRSAVNNTSGSTPSVLRAMATGKAQPIVQFGPTATRPLPAPPPSPRPVASKRAYVGEIGFFGPPHMPVDEIAVLDAAFAKVVANPQFVARAKAVGLNVVEKPHAAFQREVEHCREGDGGGGGLPQAGGQALAVFGAG